MIEERLAKRAEERKRELEQIRKSPRVTGVVIVAPDRVCPVARQIQGTYPKDSDDLPVLPYEGCSNPDGCTCRYEPFVHEVGP